MIIYPLSHRVSVTIDKVVFKIAPLNRFQKMQIVSQVSIKGGSELSNYVEMAALGLKYSIKGVTGLSLPDGSDYELAFEDDGNLTDDCVSELMLTDSQEKLVATVSALINKMADPKVEGVKVDFGEDTVKKKRSKQAR